MLLPVRSNQLSILVLQSHSWGVGAAIVVIDFALDGGGIEVVPVRGGDEGGSSWIEVVEGSREGEIVRNFMYSNKNKLLDSLLIVIQIFVVPENHAPNRPIVGCEKGTGNRFGNVVNRTGWLISHHDANISGHSVVDVLKGNG